MLFSNAASNAAFMLFPNSILKALLRKKMTKNPCRNFFNPDLATRYFCVFVAPTAANF